MITRQAQDQLFIQWLGKARIGHGWRDAFGRQRLGGLFDFGKPRPERQNRHTPAFAQDSSLADLQRHARLGQLHPGPVAARIAEGNRPLVIRRSGGDHMHQLRLIRCRHDNEARQVGQEGDVESPRMGRSIGADQPGAVDGKAHRQPLDRHVMHHLIVSALQKRRIQRAERPHPAGRQTRAEGHAMLLGDAHVETPAGKPLRKQVQPGTVRHRRRHRADPAVLGRQLHQRLAEDLCIGRRIRFRLGLFARHNVELRRRMALVARPLGRGIALALLRQHMDQDRPRRPVAHGAQDGQQLAHVMPVDRTDIGKAQRLEQGAADRQTLEHVLGPLCPLAERLGQERNRPFCRRLQLLKRRLGIKPREIR